MKWEKEWRNLSTASLTSTNKVGRKWSQPKSEEKKPYALNLSASASNFLSKQRGWWCLPYTHTKHKKKNKKRRRKEMQCKINKRTMSCRQTQCKHLDKIRARFRDKTTKKKACVLERNYSATKQSKAWRPTSEPQENERNHETKQNTSKMSVSTDHEKKREKRGRRTPWETLLYK